MSMFIADGRKYFYQWDTDREMIVTDPTITELHFCNGKSECSLVCEVVNGRVCVPNILMQTAGNIRIYGFAKDHTEVAKIYKIFPRTRPEDYVYTETEVLRYETLKKEFDDLQAAFEEHLKEDQGGGTGSGLPENSIPFQMLVSDGADATYWFNRLAFDYPATKILPKTTLAYNSGTHGYLFFTDALSEVVIGKAYMVTIYNKYRYVGIARKGVYGGMPCIGFGNPYIFPLAPGDAPPQESWYEQSLAFAVIFPPAPSADGTVNGIFALMPGAPAESITISIHLCAQKKLDKRFLPDGYGGGTGGGSLSVDSDGNAVIGGLLVDADGNAVI